MPTVIIKIPKKAKERLINTRRSIAQKYHGTCWKCNFPILPGEEYEARVLGFGKNIRMEKCHIYCPDDPEDEKERQKEKPLQKEIAA